jgi:hypothetical protein
MWSFGKLPKFMEDKNIHNWRRTENAKINLMKK